MWSEEQLEIIKSPAPIKQVIAGAGSGKTKTMIGLISEVAKKKDHRPSKTFVVTFTNKATNEFKERIKNEGLSSEYQISTFHAFCYRTLRSHQPFFKNKNWKILNELEKENWSIDFFKEFKFELGGIPFSMLSKENGKLLSEEFPEVFQIYRTRLVQWKSENKLFELEDLVRAFLNELVAQEKWTLDFLTSYERFIVDEFQDTDPIQLQILKHLNPKELTVVGDDWQAIYGFRGASPEPFLNFPKVFPDCKQYILSTNYRSLPEIVRISKIPISRNKRQIPKKTKSGRKGKGKVLFWELQQPKNDLLEVILSLQTFQLPVQVLVRSNYRKSAWQNFGMPANQIGTIHSAKGLEWENVLVDLTEGWQISNSTNQLQWEEERRILYVGLSRAKDTLILLGRSHPKTEERGEDQLFKELKGSLREKPRQFPGKRMGD